MKKLLVAFATLIMVACSTNEQQVPKGILSKHEIVPILVDLHIAEKTIASAHMPFDSSRMLYHSFFKKGILEKRNVPVEKFDSSFAFYERHTELLADVYSSVVDSLGARLSEAKLKEPE